MNQIPGVPKKIQDLYSSFLISICILSITILTVFSFLKICTYTFLGEPSVYLVFQSGQNKHIHVKLSFQGY